MKNTVFVFTFLATALSATDSYAQSFGWRRLFQGDTPCVAINPQNPNTIYTFDGHFQVSYDKGMTWNEGAAVPAVFRQILVHPSDTTLIFGAGSSSLFRSTDYGATWEIVLPNLTIDGESMAIDPLHPDTIYAGNLGDANIFRSTDRGATWTMIGDAGGGLCTLSCTSH